MQVGHCINKIYVAGDGLEFNWLDHHYVIKNEQLRL